MTMSSNAVNDTTEPRKYERTVEDVHTIVRHAKLDINSLIPVTQSIYFNNGTKDYRLLELNKELISKLDSGIELVFKGDGNDKAVLCSDDKTYEVKEAETSNSLVLIPDLKFSDELEQRAENDITIDHKTVLGVFHSYFELKPTNPKLGKLRSLLKESLYRGPELESELIESDANMYSTSNLLDLIQASKSELYEGLNESEAFELDGKWRCLEFNYHFRVLSYFLSVIDEQSWKVDEILVDEVKEILEDLIPVKILDHILFLYTEDVPSASGKPLVKLVEDKTCRFLGQFLLQNNPRFVLKDFFEAWKQCVPLGLQVNMNQLDGLIYVTNEVNQKVLHFLPHYKLSEDVAERIQFLFGLKDKWTFEEIKPYIGSFTTDKLDENAILTKYCRLSKANGIRVYSSKHGK